MNLSFLNNLDLLLVGISGAGNIILGSIIIITDRKSASHILFFLQTIILTLYSVVNYLSYQANEPSVSLWLVRGVFFCAVNTSIIFLFLDSTFPNRVIQMSKRAIYIWITIAAAGMITSLSPLLITGLQINSVAPQPIMGPGIIIFILSAILPIPVGIFLLIRRYLQAQEIDKKPLLYLLIAVSLLFSCILIFNFILPTVFFNTIFIPYNSLFIFLFVCLIFYNFFKHGLMNIKIVSSEILVLVLAIISFLEIVSANDRILILYRSAVFVAILGFGVLLIRSVINEVQQREKIEKLAKDLAKTNDDLELANDKLKELDRQKTEFVSIASHQLRSPLTAIKGYSSMLLEGSFGPIEDKAREAIDRVFQSSQKLVNVIEDFLNITRIELGRMKYEITVFDLGKVVQTVVKDQEMNAKKRGLEISLEIPDNDNHQISADEGKITQVISNLIDNAIKYTPQGWVKVRVESVANGKKGNSKIRFSVTDSGVGIALTTLPKLFEKFVRAENASKVNINGTGLGLYVAKQIIEGLRGKIWAESPGKSKGSTFFVEFPAAKKDALATDSNHKIEAYTQADFKNLKNGKDGGKK